MTTPKQRLARERNFFKRCINSFKPNINIYRHTLSEQEKSIFDDIVFKLDKLALRWDVNSVEVGLKPQNPSCANYDCESEKYFVALCKHPETEIKVFLCKNCRIEQNYNLVEYEVLGQFKESN